MDESPPSLYNLTINAGALLTFNPEVTLELRAANIFVNGNLEIGSSDCKYNGSLTITLTGNVYFFKMRNMFLTKNRCQDIMEKY